MMGSILYITSATGSILTGKARLFTGPALNTKSWEKLQKYNGLMPPGTRGMDAER